MYKIIKQDGNVVCIQDTATGAFIPIDENNRQYQEYMVFSTENAIPVYDTEGNKAEG